MMTNWNEPIEFLARTPQAVNVLAPVYAALDPYWRGAFYVPASLVDLAQSLGVDAIGLKGSVNRPLEVMPPASSAPMVTCGYRDLLTSVRLNARRAQIYFQWDDFKGSAQQKVSLFIASTEARMEWLKKTWMNKSCLVASDQAEVTAEALMSFVIRHSSIRRLDSIAGESVGIIYMAFGEKAARAVAASMLSLRRVGLQIPVCVVGDTPVDGARFILWRGESPFDPQQKRNFQFRAGRIKPFLYGLSPFDRTLYLDADTEFMADISAGFEALSEYDVAIARETITLAQLYNKKLAGWEINLQERDATISELNAGANVYFLNSGVLFFRKSPAVEAAMRRWHEAWMEWQQWDEQLAFMRAFHRTPEARVKLLEPEWNYPHRHSGIVIFHNYGRGVVRMNVGLDTPSPLAPLPLGEGEQVAA